MKSVFCVLAVAGLAAAASAAPTLSALTSFGVNGWRAPNVIQSGDSAGSNNGTNYNYLGTGNLERGMAYNPVTGNLILVSRSSAGNGLRILSGTTGNDLGRLNQGTGIISGGTFTTNKVGVSADGQIFVANLATVSGTSNYKVYRWGSETDAAPTTYLSSSFGQASIRFGDSFDATGSGANVSLVTGANTSSGGGSPSTPSGYVVMQGGTGTYVNTFSSALTGTRFRLGLTFGATADSVFGKVTSDSLYGTSYSGSTGSYSGSPAALTSAGEAQMDYVTIGGVGYLAAMDVNNSRVYIYNMTNPLAPVSLFAFGLTTTTGTLAANGNATGDVRWGAVDNGNLSATLYAMSSNQGIQAFTFAVPTPGTLGLALAGGLLAARRRR